MDAPKGAPEGAYFYTLSWAHLFAFLFALVSEFERRLTSVDSEDELSSSLSNNDGYTNEASTDDPPHLNDAPLDDLPPPMAALVPTPPAYPPPNWRPPTPPAHPPPNWRPQRREDQSHDKHDRERSPRR